MNEKHRNFFSKTRIKRGSETIRGKSAMTCIAKMSEGEMPPEVHSFLIAPIYLKVTYALQGLYAFLLLYIKCKLIFSKHTMIGKTNIIENESGNSQTVNI